MQLYSDAYDLYDALETDSVQLFWTDPPFGTNKVQEGSKHSYKDGTIQHTLDLVGDLGFVARRTLTPTGVLAVCLDYRAVHEAYAVLVDCGLHPQGEIIWHFELGGVARKWWTNKHNTILLFSKTDQPHFVHSRVPTTLRKAGRGNYTSNERKVNSVWNYTMGQTDPERVQRANQKPLDIVRPFIEVHTEPGDLVVDPFMGSGTTLVAAQELGRRFAGADIDPVARQITEERLMPKGFTYPKEGQLAGIVHGGSFYALQ